MSEIAESLRVYGHIQTIGHNSVMLRVHGSPETYSPSKDPHVCLLFDSVDKSFRHELPLQQAEELLEALQKFVNSARFCVQRRKMIEAVERRLIDATPAGHEVGSKDFKEGLRAALEVIKKTL